jgi:hypothetical protein
MYYPVQPVMPMPLQRMSPPHTSQANGGKAHSWNSFESVQVRTLEDGRYHAEVSYKDEKDNMKRFTFEGKQEEIIQQINQQKDLPQEKKQALLNALNMKPDDLFNTHPFFNSPMLFPPMFRGNPFNDPFFQQGFPMMPDYNSFSQPSAPTPDVPGSQSQGNIL